MANEAALTQPPLDLTDCEREPIHIPGAIQPHGMLLAAEAGSLDLLQVSGNCRHGLDRQLDDLLNINLLDLVHPEARSRVEEHLLLDDVARVNPLRLPLLVSGEPVVFDTVVQRTGPLLILELENPRPGSRDFAGAGIPSESFYSLMRDLMQAQRETASIEAFMAEVCSQVQRITGFDRVMVYRFAEDWHGEVIAETVRGELEPYLGLHFPAGDIPAQARRLYEENWLRIISNVHYTPSPLVPQTNPLTGEPLDMSGAMLRSVSPIHVQYLKNMGVGAAMSISLLHEGRLWGLVACHHPQARYLPFHLRAACITLGAVVSSQLSAKQAELATQRRNMQHRKLGRLLQKVARGQILLVGQTPTERQVRRLLQFLDSQDFSELFVTDHLTGHLPEAREYADTAGGLLAIRFPERSDSYWLLFRPEVAQTVRWGGNPHQPARLDPAAGALSPRNSFAEWCEEIRGRSLPWSEMELELAREIHNSVTLNTLRQAEELGRVNRALVAKTKEMEQFVYTVSHDLKSPLVTCRGFVGMMKEDLARGEFGHLLDSARRIENATAQMNALIDDLLTYSRLGSKGLERSMVEVEPIVEQLRQRYAAALEERQARLVVETPLPPLYADRMAVERALDNLLANALKYACDAPGAAITLGARERKEAVQYYVRDQGPGIDPEYHQLIFRLFQRLDNRRKGTGVGLASVSKIMEQHGGEVRVESQPGRGATFQLSFPRRDRGLQKTEDKLPD